jgi:hypothetical protein
VCSVHPVPDGPLNDSFWHTAGWVRSCDQQFQSFQFLYVVLPISAVPWYVQPVPLVTEGSPKNTDKYFKYFSVQSHRYNDYEMITHWHVRESQSSSNQNLSAPLYSLFT